MAQTVESPQDRAQVIPLTKLKIAMHEDECVNEGALDLHEETRRRVRGHIIDYWHGAFSLPEQRARCRKAVPDIGNGQGTALDRIQRP